jgi:(p)ppGpp synthase/HD superfamily hydrolase
MSNLERAIEIAVLAHKGQTDKGGNPYILHPLRVMMALDSETEKIVGVLHDVVEDSEWTLDGLEKEGFGPEVLQALISVILLE